MKYIQVYTLILLFVSFSSCGQKQTNLAKENIGQITIKPEIKDSITSGVWDIEQDRNGNIWFAADDAVYRYDGKSYTKITGEMSAKHFFSVFEDRKGNFWFGTQGSGVYYYDGKSFQNFTTKEGLVNNNVMPVYEDNTGIIWIGTAGGVSRYDGKSFRNFTTSDGLTNNDVHAIVQDKTGKIWFGTRREITMYDGKTFTTLTDKDGKTFRNVWAMIKDKNDNIWFGAESLWRYDGNAFTKFDQVGPGVMNIDKKGNLLFSIGGPIFRYDERSLSDKNPHVTVINTGYEGRLNLPFGLLGAEDGSIWHGHDRYSFDGKTLTKSK